MNVMSLSVVSEHNRTLSGAARWLELREQRFGEGSAQPKDVVQIVFGEIIIAIVMVQGVSSASEEQKSTRQRHNQRWLCFLPHGSHCTSNKLCSQTAHCPHQFLTAGQRFHALCCCSR